jgi:hypothetical protein
MPAIRQYYRDRRDEKRSIAATWARTAPSEVVSIPIGKGYPRRAAWRAAVRADDRKQRFARHGWLVRTKAELRMRRAWAKAVHESKR